MKTDFKMPMCCVIIEYIKLMKNMENIKQKIDKNIEKIDKLQNEMEIFQNLIIDYQNQQERSKNVVSNQIKLLHDIIIIGFIYFTVAMILFLSLMVYPCYAYLSKKNQICQPEIWDTKFSDLFILSI